MDRSTYGEFGFCAEDNLLKDMFENNGVDLDEVYGVKKNENSVGEAFKNAAKEALCEMMKKSSIKEEPAVSNNFKPNAELRKIYAEIHKSTKSGVLNFGNFCGKSFGSAAQGALDELEYQLIMNSHIDFVIFPGAQITNRDAAVAAAGSRKLSILSLDDFARDASGKYYSAIFGKSFKSWGDLTNVKYVTKWEFFENVIADDELRKFISAKC